MPSHERENARKERQRKNDLKTKRAVWIILAVIIIILIVLKVCEVDFASIKDRFTDENGKFSISMGASDEAYPFELDSSENVRISSNNDKLNILTDQSMTVLNPGDAEVIYSFSHGYANPIARYSKPYYCIVDQGATRFRLDTNTENIYEEKTDLPILCADVAGNGTVAYATKGKDVKSTLYVINNKLDKKMTLDINDGYIVFVAIDASGKKIAYATINSKDAKSVVTVHTMSVGDEEPKATFDFVDTDILDLRYSNSSDLYFVGNDMVAVITSQKNLKEVFKKGSVYTVDFTYTSNDELVYAGSEFSQSEQCTVSCISSSGKVKTSINLNQNIKDISSYSNEISVLFDDRIEVYSRTKGNLKATHKCDSSVKSIHKMSNKIFVYRQKLISVIE